MTQKTLRLFCMLLIVFAVSCSTKNENKFLGVNVPIDEMNTVFRIEDTPVMANTHKNNDLLTFQLVNLSDISVVFPGDFGIKIFIKGDEGWILVENNFHYPSEENTLLTHDLFPPGLVVDLSPSVRNLQKSETIRIILVGHKANFPNELVGAYIDTLLLP